jgi:hypothetical protein
MDVAEIKARFRATPFQPFEFVMPNGSAIEVPHPDFMAVAPDSRTVVVFSTTGDDGMKILDPKSITGLNLLPSGKRSKKKS